MKETGTFQKAVFPGSISGGCDTLTEVLTVGD